MQFVLKFLSPEKRIEGKEMRSKLISNESPLYDWLSLERKKVTEIFPDISDPQRMDFHIELIKKDEIPSEDLLLSRVKELEGKEIYMNKRLNKKTYQVDSPLVSGYGDTHITIVHFSEEPDSTKYDFN